MFACLHYIDRGGLFLLVVPIDISKFYVYTLYSLHHATNQSQVSRFINYNCEARILAVQWKLSIQKQRDEQNQLKNAMLWSMRVDLQHANIDA